MNHKSHAYSLSWLQEQYKGARLELRPPFQRKPVWTAKQRCSLIESILMDIPIPEVYVQVTQSEDGSLEYGVVDGQQRLRTILQFIGLEREEDREGEDVNRFSLDALQNSPYANFTFARLDGEQRKAFFRYEICFRLLYTDDVKEVEDVFKRLNKFTMPLKAQELRNATYHGAFAKLSEELANDEYWAVNKIVTPAAIRRMADIEMMSDLLIALLHGPQGGSAKVIDQYYEQYEMFDDEFPEQERVKKEFDLTLTTIQKIFPNISGVSRWGNRADFYSLFVALATLLRTHDAPRTSERAVREALLSFAAEVDQRLQKPSARVSAAAKNYTRAIEKGSNDKARRLDRHEALVGLLEPLLRKQT